MPNIIVETIDASPTSSKGITRGMAQSSFKYRLKGDSPRFASLPSQTSVGVPQSCGCVNPRLLYWQTKPIKRTNWTKLFTCTFSLLLRIDFDRKREALLNSMRILRTRYLRGHAGSIICNHINNPHCVIEHLVNIEAQIIYELWVSMYMGKNAKLYSEELKTFQ